MAIHVRPFEEIDRETLRRLYLDSRNATFTWDPAGSHQASDFDRHTEGEVILVAVVDDEIRGFASIWVPDSFLHNLFVHPSHKRQGIGQALLKGCDPHFANTPTLKCRQANVNAAQFYHSQGWITLRDETGPEGPYHLMAKCAPIAG